MSNSVMLGKHITFVKRGITPRYTENDGIIVISQKCIRDGRLSFGLSRFTANDTKIPDDKYIVNGDILINSTGTGTLGRVSYVENTTCPITVDTHVTILRVDNKIYSKFLYFYLFYNEGYIASLGRGATNQQELNSEAIKGIHIPDLPFSSQCKIADILSNYDNLIENNIQQIKLMEEAIQLLYYEWFIKLCYPGHEEIVKVDGIPQGWERKTLEEVIEFDPTIKTEKDSVYKFLPMSALNENSMTIKFDMLESRNNNSGSKFENDDTLLARITPCLENGKTAFVNFLNEDEVAIGSTEFIVMRSLKLNPYLVYCLARTDRFREIAIKSMVGASGRQRVQRKVLEKMDYNLPTSKLINEFGETVGPLFKNIRVLQRQIQSLRQARDMLLPKLMSGTIEV